MEPEKTPEPEATEPAPEPQPEPEPEPEPAPVKKKRAPANTKAKKAPAGAGPATQPSIEPSIVADPRFFGALSQTLRSLQRAERTQRISSLAIV